MKRAILFGLFCSLVTVLSGQQKLSEQAEIRLVTGGPYQGELYSAFGHSAVRVYDPRQGLDILYNYGVFDFEQPNFYLNFARGHLLYQLQKGSYRRFVLHYSGEGRFIHEQILNLSQAQKQAYFEFLEVNALPQNREYFYDYFYDNCATRIRDGLKETLGDSLQFDLSYVSGGLTIRELCDLYLEEQAWGDLGIDLCLGLPMDKKASPWEYMFLPDYLELAFAEAQIITPRGYKPLVRETLITYEPSPAPAAKTLIKPWLFTTLLLIMGLGLSWFYRHRAPALRYFDGILFSITGLLGFFLLALWLLTDHSAAAYNFNIWWALPSHLIFGILLFRKRRRSLKFRYYFAFTTVVYLILIIGWFFWPQKLHVAWLPFTLLLLLRAALIARPKTPTGKKVYA